MSDAGKTAMESALAESAGLSEEEMAAKETRPGAAKRAAAEALEATPPAVIESDETIVIVTDEAAKNVRGLLESENIPAEEHNLRVYVEAGGCSGFSYGLGFDKMNDGDTVTSCEGFKIIIDPKSLPHLKGLTVDWVDTVQEQGFKLINPNAKSECGCGQSFQT